MGTSEKIAGVIFGIIVIFFCVRALKSNPEALSKQSITKSLYTMGVLGLILVAVVGTVVVLLR